jgi:hypothetical protein
LGTVPKKSPLNSSIKAIEQFSPFLHHGGEIIKEREGDPITIAF